MKIQKKRSVAKRSKRTAMKTRKKRSMPRSSKHTPLPWRIETRGSVPGWHVSREKATILCGRKGKGDTSIAIINENLGEESEANAQFIFRACNSHEALVKALREIAEGKGRYSADLLTHASNTIEDMTAIANAALADLDALVIDME